MPLRPLVPRTPTHSSGRDPRSHFPDALPQPFQTPSGMSPYCIVTTLNRRLLRSFTNISHGCNLKVKPHAPPAVRFALVPQWASSLRGSAGAGRSTAFLPLVFSPPRVLLTGPTPVGSSFSVSHLLQPCSMPCSESALYFTGLQKNKNHGEEKHITPYAHA